jgi:hypothetical protein
LFLLILLFCRLHQNESTTFVSEAGKETPVALVAQGRIIPLLPAPNSKEILVFTGD